MNTIILKHGTWVMVADGEKALFLRNAGDNKYPNLEVVQEIQQDNPPTREQGSDSPGRYNDGPSVHRSAVEDTDWHRIGRSVSPMKSPPGSTSSRMTANSTRSCSSHRQWCLGQCAKSCTRRSRTR